MRFATTALPGVLLIEPQVFGDGRGFFMETWNARVFAEAGLDMDFVQDNHSRSRQGILRGLHYQIQRVQGKLVRVVVGEVFDVAVDLRRGSPAFGHWLGAYLSAENQRMLWIPPGFGHGYYVISETADLLYKCTDFYAPEHERCIRWDDADLAIAWPLVGGQAPILSAKDRSGMSFRVADFFP